VWLPVAVVDVVPGELGVEEVKPGKVHVDDEALEGPDVSSVVARRTAREASSREASTIGQCFFGRATPPPADPVPKGRPTFVLGAAHSYGVAGRRQAWKLFNATAHAGVGPLVNVLTEWSPSRVGKLCSSLAGRLSTAEGRADGCPPSGCGSLIREERLRRFGVGFGQQ
jgi:hypothetical protein